MCLWAATDTVHNRKGNRARPDDLERIGNVEVRMDRHSGKEFAGYSPRDRQAPAARMRIDDVRGRLGEPAQVGKPQAPQAGA